MGARIGEWDVHVIPWVNYNDHGEPWIAVNLRRDVVKGRKSLWLSHNGSRFARSTYSWEAEKSGISMNDLTRYLRSVWGRPA